VRTPDAETVATALAFVVALGAIAMTYRRQRYWERQSRVWHERLKRRIGVLRTLRRDARETQEAFRATEAPASLHAAFIARCDAALRTEFGAAYAARVDQRLSETWLQPPGLESDEHIFAWYDTERRIAGLQELINEAADDLASLGVPWTSDNFKDSVMGIKPHDGVAAADAHDKSAARRQDRDQGRL
jgi:hypothetical protein